MTTPPTITPEAREAAGKEFLEKCYEGIHDSLPQGHFVQLLLDKQRGELENKRITVVHDMASSSHHHERCEHVITSLVVEIDTLTTRLSDLEKIACSMRYVISKLPHPVVKAEGSPEDVLDCAIDEAIGTYQLYLITHYKK